MQLKLLDISSRTLRALATEHESKAGLTYAQAGVSVDAGNALVEAIKPHVRRTKRAGADGTIGGFGGAFDLKAAGYTDPVLVSGTDGVGTKLMVAAAVGVHDTIGRGNCYRRRRSLADTRQASIW